MQLTAGRSNSEGIDKEEKCDAISGRISHRYGQDRHLQQHERAMLLQLQLDNGERILISIAQTGIALFKLDMAGLVPTQALFEWNISEVGSAIRLFADLSTPQKPPLDAMRDRLLQCRSVEEVLALCYSQ